MSKTVFETLSVINMAEHVKADQGGNKYIKWADCWAVLLKHYPDSTFEFHENEVGDAFFVSSFGVEVRVSVTVDGLKRTFTHPVLNSINKSMKLDGYSYTTKKGDKHVEPCSTFDINSARMRALVKCIGMHGLAIYLYRDDLNPEVELVDSKQLQEVVDKIKAKELSLSDVCAQWNMSKIAQLQADNFDTMIDWLDKQ